MNEGNYILVNGSFVPSAEYRISLKESAGFLFSEKIRSVRTSFPFFRESLEMIKQKLLIFNQSFDEFTKGTGEGLKRQMERTLTKNKQFLGSLFTIRFWISEQKIQYSIQCIKCENAGYELNTNGLYIDIFQKVKKSASSLSHSSLGSETFWQIASNHLKDSHVEQFLLLNTDDQIIEAIGSNVYLIKNSIVRGASINQGAYTDITKSFMLNIFVALKLNFDETEGITEQDIKEAEEILLVDAIDGIRWVVGFGGKRYFNQTIRKINELFIRNLVN